MTLRVGHVDLPFALPGLYATLLSASPWALTVGAFTGLVAAVAVRHPRVCSFEPKHPVIRWARRGLLAHWPRTRVTWSERSDSACPWCIRIVSEIAGHARHEPRRYGPNGRWATLARTTSMLPPPAGSRTT